MRNPCRVPFIETDTQKWLEWAEMTETIENAVAYAIRRRRETGRPYIVSAQGHALLDCPANRKLCREFGGVIFRS
jgi:hypothetical protein